VIQAAVKPFGTGEGRAGLVVARQGVAHPMFETAVWQ